MKGAREHGAHARAVQRDGEEGMGGRGKWPGRRACAMIGSADGLVARVSSRGGPKDATLSDETESAFSKDGPSSRARLRASTSSAPAKESAGAAW